MARGNYAHATVKDDCAARRYLLDQDGKISVEQVIFYAVPAIATEY